VPTVKANQSTEVGAEILEIFTSNPNCETAPKMWEQSQAQRPAPCACYNWL